MQSNPTADTPTIVSPDVQTCVIAPTEIEPAPLYPDVHIAVVGAFDMTISAVFAVVAFRRATPIAIVESPSQASSIGCPGCVCCRPSQGCSTETILVV